MASSRPIFDDPLLYQIYYCNDILDDGKYFLWELISKSKDQDTFSKPMPWIGMYIASASLFCILAIVADLLHGFRNRKFWFPCKYFTLNAASLTIIAVAMKLPVDLSNPMRGDLDQSTKIASLAFMCTMMANLLPSIATMDSKEILTNMVALGVLVITIIVNVCIQIYTGVVEPDGISGSNWGFHGYRLMATINVAMLLLLLIIQTCSALTILKSKQILESKYQTGHQTAMRDPELQPSARVSVENLKKHVSQHWIMEGTGNPQFIMAYSATTSASAVICSFSAILLFIVTIKNYRNGYSDLKHYESDYKWSTPVIFVTQSVGIVLGTIAPLCRCFAALSFKLSVKWIKNHIKVFKIESYWTQKLCDWKQGSIPISVNHRKSKIVIHNFKILILSFCIGFQMTVVVACKMIALIATFFVMCVSFCIRCWKWIMFGTLGFSWERNPEQLENNEDLKRYVLQLQNDIEVDEGTLKSITKSMNLLIQKAKKKQPKNLIKLLEGSKGFEGVRNYDSHHVPHLSTEAFLDSWSLPLISLTTIAISLPEIRNDRVDRLLSSVSQGLVYVTLVEESLSATTDEYVSIQKAGKMLWLEVELYNKWLGQKLQSPDPDLNTAGVILQWFKTTAKNMVTEVESKNIQSSNDDSIYRSISANSMYRITESILLSYNTNIEQVSQDVLFKKLSSMIADILAACLTNLPQIIVTKCHTNVIEKREASVRAAAQLFGETSLIINSLQDCELPSLSPNELLSIDKWRAFLQHSIP